MLSKAEPDTCLEHLQQNQIPVWNTYSRTRHLSGTLAAEPDTCLEYCLGSNNTYTNYSSGHPVSEDPLPLPPVTIHFRQNFDHFLPEPPSPHLLDVINVCSQTFAVILTSHWIFKTFYWQILRNFSEMGSQQYIIVF